MSLPKSSRNSLNAEVSKNLTSPKLVWSKCEEISYNCFEIVQSSQFPFKTLYDIQSSIENSKTYLHNKNCYVIDRQFMKFVCHAECVTIIQENFDDKHWMSINNYFNDIPFNSTCQKSGINIKQFYIISSNHINSLPMQLTNTCKVKQIKNFFKGSKYLNRIGFHDRLVLLDNSIWHFGGSVCCMMEKPMAYSGPWYDEGSSLKHFIDSLCK